MIHDHYLPEDLNQLNEELLNLHNTATSIIKDAQKGEFIENKVHQGSINQSIEVIMALYNKKLKREEQDHLNDVYALKYPPKVDHYEREDDTPWKK